MSETMGQIIKRLRKDKNFTQEELAEQVGVTCQAVSKWENDSGLPDISQVVPLSVVFGVPTDVLFGRYNTNDEVTIDNIIKEATAPLKTDTNNYSEADCYNFLTNALKTYPNNTKLLLEALSYGCSILMDNDVETEEQKDRLYTECLHHAELVINYSKDVSSVLRAHKWLIYLYCHFGQFEKAKEHASMFPKAVETQGMMQAWIARAMKNTDEEIDQRCHIFASLLSSIEFELRPLGDAYKRQGKFEEAMLIKDEKDMDNELEYVDTLLNEEIEEKSIVEIAQKTYNDGIFNIIPEKIKNNDEIAFLRYLQLKNIAEYTHREAVDYESISPYRWS